MMSVDSGVYQDSLDISVAILHSDDNNFIEIRTNFDGVIVRENDSIP